MLGTGFGFVHGEWTIRDSDSDTSNDTTDDRANGAIGAVSNIQFILDIFLKPLKLTQPSPCWPSQKDVYLRHECNTLDHQLNSNQ